MAIQYDTIRDVKKTLRLGGMMLRHISIEERSSLSMLNKISRDADLSSGIWKLCMSLISHARKEDRRGVTVTGDLDLFFSFEKIEELMEYEV